MIDNDCTSDDSMSSSDSELALSEVSRLSESRDDISDSVDKGGPLKQAIKENENSIIQSILSPPILHTTNTDADKSNNSDSTSDKTTSTVLSEGLSPLLDYLFEDGQLTRIEYDIVDKGYGINSATEQVQVLLRILLESKGDEALKSLVRCLKKLYPTSDTIQKLFERLSPAALKGTKTSIFCNEMKPDDKASSNIRSSKKRHDFYYGRERMQYFNQLLNRERWENLDASDELARDKTLNAHEQLNKPKASFDYTDFYLTKGCLDTIRSLILDNCKESTTALGWEKVLRNMNGLLNTDVQSIKDMLFQIKRVENQRVLEVETRAAKMVRKIYKDRRRLYPSNVQEKQKSENNEAIESEYDRRRKGFRRYDADNSDNYDENEVSSSGKKIRNEQSFDVNWNQVIYHSFQVWKQRNGLNSTFYSLIGAFQHSKLYQTADFLIESKKEIQSKENEKEIADEGSIIDVNNGTRSSAASTMLEKSEFLRKFYTPSRRNDSHSVGLVTTRDRVSASPVLSLDLL